jgi:large-conductance mechanosensitive channel
MKYQIATPAATNRATPKAIINFLLSSWSIFIFIFLNKKEKKNKLN